MIANRIAIITADCVITDRPGEDVITIEGARLDAPTGPELGILTMPRALQDAVEGMLEREPTEIVCCLLDLNEDHVFYALVQPAGMRPVYTDGMFHYDPMTLEQIRAGGRRALPRAA